MGGVGGLHLEGAVIGPEVNGVCDAGAAALVDLDEEKRMLALYMVMMMATMARRAGCAGRGQEPTISADSGPEMLNSRSAYFFQ